MNYIVIQNLKGVDCMATISFRLSDEEKRLITDFSKRNNITVSELILNSILEKIEDEEDYALGEKIMLDPNTKITGTLKELAEECGIDYDKL